MKAISLHQPWASAVAFGYKTIETRHWPIGYRGNLLIHAAKKTQIADCRIHAHFQPVVESLEELHFHLYGTKELPAGALVAVATLDECTPTERVPHERLHREVSTIYGPYTEFVQGNYAPDRYAWYFSRVQRFMKPIPYRGSQGIFHVDDAMLSQHVLMPGRNAL